jgi:uncharacterized protein
MTTQNSFVWHELLTRDVAAAKDFYAKVIGWSMQDMPMFGGSYTNLTAGSVAIGGIMALPPGAEAMKPFWAPYIEVADVDAAAVKLQAAGGSIHRQPQDIPNVGRFAVVADPQGAMFNLFKSQGSSVRSVTMQPGQVGWNELHAKDAAKAWEFYQGLFGWQKGDAMDMGPMGKYQTFAVNDAPAGAMFNSPEAARGSFWMTYFGVTDIDAAGRRASEAGGKIMHGPAEVPGGRWIIQAADPQGAWFAMLGKRG